LPDRKARSPQRRARRRRRRSPPPLIWKRSGSCEPIGACSAIEGRISMSLFFTSTAITGVT
jgi:hypothetical protein